MVTPFFLQYFTENHNSTLKFSVKESSVYFGSPVPVLEDFTSVKVLRHVQNHRDRRISSVEISCPQSLSSVAPLTKKPEDSGYEIAWLLTRL